MAVYMNQGVPWFGLLNWNPLTRSAEAGRWRHSGRVLTISARLPVTELFSVIRQFKPHLVRCSPWQAWRAVVGALRAGEAIPKVPVLVAGSEVVTPVVRQTLQRYLAGRLINHYGATDSGHLASDCGAGHLHVCWQAAHLEVLADNDQPAQPGEPGEVVVTNLRLKRRPIVRVRTGDLAVLGQGPCPCGNPTPYFESVIGRKKDCLRLPNGEAVNWPELETELAGFGSNLLGYQLEQREGQQVLVRLCLLETDSSQSEIENRLRAKLPGLQVALAVTDHFQPSPTGKTLPVIGLEV